MDARALINSAKRRRLSAGDAISTTPSPAPRVIKLPSSAGPTSKKLKLGNIEEKALKSRPVSTNGSSTKKENTSTTPSPAPTLPPTNNTTTNNSNGDYVSITSSSMDLLLNKGPPAPTQPPAPRKIIKLGNSKSSIPQISSLPPPPTTKTKPQPSTSKQPPKPQPAKQTTTTTSTTAKPLPTKSQPSKPQATKTQPTTTTTTTKQTTKPQALKPQTKSTPDITTSRTVQSDSTTITSDSVFQLIGNTSKPAKTPPTTTTPSTAFTGDLTYITSANVGAILQASIPPAPPAPPKKIIKLKDSKPPATRPPISLSHASALPTAKSSTTLAASRKRPLSASTSSLSPASAKLQKMIQLKSSATPASSIPSSTALSTSSAAPKRKILKLSSSAPLPSRTTTISRPVQKTVKISSLTQTTTAQTTTTTTTTTTSTTIGKKAKTSSSSMIMFPGLDEETPSAEGFLSTLSSLLE